MPGYVIAEVDVTDPAAYEEYRKLVAPTIAKYGGRFLVRGGACESLEGDWRPARVVVLEFPDVAAAKAWYGSQEYGPLIKVRQSAPRGHVILVEGA